MTIAAKKRRYNVAQDPDAVSRSARLREVRRIAGLSQEKCALLVHCSRGYLSMIEQGVTRCPPALLARIERMLDVKN